jgi:hypothetical protein
MRTWLSALSGAILGFILMLPAAHAAGPFEVLAGEWVGPGRVAMKDGTSSAIRCKASYAVAGAGNVLTMSLNCASDSFKISASSLLEVKNGQITGSWQESTLNLVGDVFGIARGGTIDVTLSGSVLLRLHMVTSGANQTVSLSAQQDLPIRSVSIRLSRR